jgi:hypothetical protein
LSLSRPVVSEPPSSTSDAEPSGPVAIGPSTATALPGRALAVVPDNAPGHVDLVKWFNETDVRTGDALRWAEVVPPSCAEEMVAEANRRAQAWLDFARVVGARAASAS